eukprot:scaffold94_cov254-Pinguiococcus_pyrenoidosus.AAC.8
MDGEETRQATAVLVRIRDEESALARLKKEILARQLPGLEAAIDQMIALGLDNEIVSEARAVRDRLYAERKAAERLKHAMASRDAKQLAQTLQAAQALLPPSDPMLREARAAQAQLEQQLRAIKQLKDAIATRRRAALDAALASAEECQLQPDATPALAQAQKLREAVGKEEAAVEAVLNAAQSKDLAALDAALKAAEALGISNAEVDEARQLFHSLSPGSRKAAASPRFPNQRETEVAELRAATAAGDKDALARLLSRSRVTSGRYNADVAAAWGALETLTTQDNAREQLATLVDAARLSRDPQQLASGLEAAERAEVAPESLHEARDLLKELTLCAALDTAVNRADVEKAREHFREALELGVDESYLTRSRVLLDREKMVEETSAELRSALVKDDLDELNDALELGIQLGMRGSAIDNAKERRDKLQQLVAATAMVTAAKKTLVVKLESPVGISESDVLPLQDAIREAKENGVCEDDGEMKEAAASLTRAQGTIAILKDFERVMALGDQVELSALKELKSRVEDLELVHLNIVRDLRRAIRDREAASTGPEKDANRDSTRAEDVDVQEVEEEAQRKHDIAQHSRYQFQNYGRLRSPDEYARGVLLHKTRAKQNMLKFQTTLVCRSLTELDKEKNRLALQINKSILGYMGEKQMSFPAMLAQNILQKGLDDAELRDEIYLQVLKQLVDNPHLLSVSKGWQLLCMSATTFPPSVEFELYLINFVINHLDDKATPIRQYARFVSRTLDGMLVTGPSGFVPTVEEIQAYKERPPILATIEIVDGTKLTEDLPVTPDLNVQKVLDICTHFLDLTEPRASSLGIVVEELQEVEEEDPPTPGQQVNPVHTGLWRVPKVLKGDDFMGDVVVQYTREHRQYRFVLKQTLFMPDLSGPSPDEVYTKLLFLQGEHSLLWREELKIDDMDTMAELVALSMAAELEENFPKDEEGFLQANVTAYVAPSWAEKATPEEWAKRAAARSKGWEYSSPHEFHTRFNEIAMAHPRWGFHIFPVKTMPSKHKRLSSLPEKVLFGFNFEGLHVIDEKDNAVLTKIVYTDIFRWSGSTQHFAMVIADASRTENFEFSAYTPQAADINAVILNFVDFIIHRLDEKEEKKDDTVSQS